MKLSATKSIVINYNVVYDETKMSEEDAIETGFYILCGDNLKKKLDGVTIQSLEANEMMERTGDTFVFENWNNNN